MHGQNHDSTNQHGGADAPHHPKAKGKKMENINTCGTSYRGQFRLPYAKVIELLGQPNAQSDGYKTDIEWSFEKDGVVATVYNWKNGPNYTGSGSVEDINVWNIGGFNVQAIYLVSDKLGGQGELHLFK